MTGKTSTRARAARGEGERLREEILDAAEQLLAERGVPDAVTMRAIADRVGVTPPAIYLHFADKDELFFECCARRFTEMSAFMEDAARDKATATKRLEAMGRAYIEFGLSRGEQYKVIFAGPLAEAEIDRGGADSPGVQALRMVAGTFAEGVATGEFRSELDPLAAAVALWAAVHGAVLVIMHARGDVGLPDVDEQTVIGTLTESLLAGLAP